MLPGSTIPRHLRGLYLTFRISFGALLAAATLSSHGNPRSLFEENFDNLAENERSLASIGWSIANAASISSPVVIPERPRANAFGVLSAGSGTGNGQPGYIWTSVGSGQIRIFTRQIHKLPPLTVASIHTVSFDTVVSAKGIANVYLLIQLGDADWYLAKDEFFPVAVGNKKSFSDAPDRSAIHQTLVFTPAASNWQALSFTEGSPLKFSPLNNNLPTDTPITGVGFLVHNTQSGKGGVVIRIDTLNMTSQ